MRREGAMIKQKEKVAAGKADSGEGFSFDSS